MLESTKEKTMPLKTRRCVYQTKRMKRIQPLQLLSPLKFLIPLEWEVISSQSQPVANHIIRYIIGIIVSYKSSGPDATPPNNLNRSG
jgi:hypothetical protein